MFLNLGTNAWPSTKPRATIKSSTPNESISSAILLNIRETAEAYMSVGIPFQTFGYDQTRSQFGFRSSSLSVRIAFVTAARHSLGRFLIPLSPFKHPFSTDLSSAPRILVPLPTFFEALRRSVEKGCLKGENGTMDSPTRHVGQRHWRRDGQLQQGRLRQG